MTEFRPQFGMDPEVFAVKKASKRTTAHSAHTFETFRPLASKDDAESSACTASMKTDGFAFEFNSTPTHCRDWLLPATGGVIRKFYEKYNEYGLTAIPKMRLAKTSLRNAPEDVMGYGCVPDRNAYTLEEKTPDARGYLDKYRYTGGHLHFSLKDNLANKELLAAAATIVADIFLGIPLVAIIGEANDYGEADRRFYYGQAGSHRVTPYGFEYRVPSSAIMLTPMMLSWSIGQLRKVLGQRAEYVYPFDKPPTFTHPTGTQFPFYSLETETVNRYPIIVPRETPKEALTDFVKGLHAKYNFNLVQNIINSHDVAAARAFVASHGIAAPTTMYQSRFYDLMLKADQDGIVMPTDLFEGWGLKHKSAISHSFIGVEGFMVRGFNTIYPDYAPYLGTAGWGIKYDEEPEEDFDEDDYNYDYDDHEEGDD